ncbi:hypothetical protein BH24GEM1_BH24GEM1_23550 [soil metagenome]
MRGWVCLLPLLAAACSGLEEFEGGVAAVEIHFPALPTLEVGEQVQLTARALDAEGEVVDAAISWRASDIALGVDPTGLVTGIQPGAASVQAAVGSLTSERVGFTVLAPADTLVIEGDSVLIVPAADPPASTSLTVRLESRTPPGPAGLRPVVFEIARSLAGASPAVQLTGGVQSDTVTSAADGTASTGLSLVSGQVPPDTAIVEVRATRTRGAAVPGSGQRFIALFQ